MEGIERKGREGGRDEDLKDSAVLRGMKGRNKRRAWHRNLRKRETGRARERETERESLRKETSAVVSYVLKEP